MKILFYVDLVVAYSNGVAAAEMLRRKLDAQIILMTVDSEKYLNTTTKSFELYDYSSLMRPGAGFARVWPREQQAGNDRAPFALWAALRAVRNSGRRYSSLMRPGAGFARVWPREQQAGNDRAPFALWATLRAVRNSGRRLKFGIARRLRNVLGLSPASAMRGPAVLPHRSASNVITSAAVSSIERRVTSMIGQLCLPHNLRADAISAATACLSMLNKARERSWPVLRLLMTYQSIGRFLDAMEPDLIILPEDNVETLSSVFVAQGRRRGIPTIILPFTLPNPVEPAQFYRNSADHQAAGPAAQVLCKLWPKWRFHFDGADLLRLPAPVAFLTEFLRVSSPDPWVLNRGGAVAIVLDSQAQRDQYLRLGFPADQLHVIGDLNGDALYNATCSKDRLLALLCRAHGFEVSKPVVLCAFPPDQFDSHGPSDFEFANYQSMVGAWAGVFRELGQYANFVVRPHPRSSISQIELMRSHGLEISMEPTVELVPLCDVYLASISATIRWAIACGIPVINYDTYRYRYEDFNGAAGVFRVETVDDFRTTLRRLLTQPEFALEARLKQRESMLYWGLSDGKTSDRLADLARKVVGDGIVPARSH